MWKRTKEGVRRSKNLITVFLVKLHGFLAGIQLNFFNPGFHRSSLQCSENGFPDTALSLRRVHRHVTDLAAIFDRTVQPTDPDQSTVLIPDTEMNGFILKLIFLRTGRLAPWFAQDSPPKCVVRFKLRFACWGTNEHGRKRLCWATSRSIPCSLSFKVAATLFAFREISDRQIDRL